ncbi:MAG: sigma-70 family RNA polymerase sigma factor, partial [Defluviitaleaceae bacterium]|nr:sigma-70 family RNA polymerase sigma factor [Defluviitaleaceae bacterium]
LSMPEMMKALEALNPTDRALLYGRIVDGQSYKELSRIMGISEPNLRKQYERAKNKAAKLLNASGYGLVDASYVPNV